MSEYLYGVHFHGRDFMIWCDSREEAIAEAEAVEDKHAPAELVRVPLEVERSGEFFYGARINGAERRWHSTYEAMTDGAHP